MNHAEIITHVLITLPKCTTICIAGGAAVDAERAGDVDVWFRAKDLPLALKYLTGFQAHTKGSGGTYDHEDGGGSIVGEAYDPTIQKVVQVLTYGHKNLDNLLKSFDISTHQKAILGTGKVFEGPGYTLMNQPPKVLLWKNKTFARYVKICQRYGHPVDVEVLKVGLPKTFNPDYNQWKLGALQSSNQLTQSELNSNKLYYTNWATSDFNPSKLGVITGISMNEEPLPFENSSPF